MSGDRSDRTVVVVGAGGATGTESMSGSMLESTPHRYAALIEDLAGARTEVLDLDPEAPREFRAALDALPGEVGVLFLPHTSPEIGCRVRDLAGVPVLTGQDTVAIALAAAVSTTLASAGRAPRAGQVVIAGADALPVLCPLVMIGGVGTVTTWNLTDAHAFPLSRVTAGADVVIDLLAGTPTSRAGTGFGPCCGPAVITPDHERDTALALPGLIRAILRTPGARLDIEVHHACALALVMGTPPDGLLPREPDRELTERIADAASAALRSNRPFEYDLG